MPADFSRPVRPLGGSWQPVWPPGVSVSLDRVYQHKYAKSRGIFAFSCTLAFCTKRAGEKGANWRISREMSGKMAKKRAWLLSYPPKKQRKRPAPAAPSGAEKRRLKMYKRCIYAQKGHTGDETSLCRLLVGQRWGGLSVFSQQSDPIDPPAGGLLRGRSPLNTRPTRGP